MEKFGSEVPAGRPGQPWEFAGPFVFLASEDSTYVAGEILAVTGRLPFACLIDPYIALHGVVIKFDWPARPAVIWQATSSLAQVSISWSDSFRMYIC